MQVSGTNLRFLVLVLVSILMINVDTHTRTLAPVRAVLGLAVTPLQDLVQVPRNLSDWVSLRVVSEPELLERLETLRETNLRQALRIQQIEALTAENRRLRELLSASRRGFDRVILAEIEATSFEPYTQSILINKGIHHQVHEGQPVLDAHGVMGQVIRTSYFKSVVSLVTDPGQTVPVLVERNGLRALTAGIGSEDWLEVPHLDRNTDIRRGDLLVTSGMGGRFPHGYPVARVVEVTVDVNEPFLKVTAEPVARLGFSREVMLVWPGMAAEVEQAAGNGVEEDDMEEEESSQPEFSGTPREDSGDAAGQ